jgi:hypothetical protein
MYTIFTEFTVFTYIFSLKFFLKQIGPSILIKTLDITRKTYSEYLIKKNFSFVKQKNIKHVDKKK